MNKNILIFIGVGILVFGLGIGGYFFLIPRCPKSCDDGNPCTQDFCSPETDYQCEHSPIVGTTEDCQELVEICKQYQCVESECQIAVLADCCGNEKCEAGEDWETCPQDCELCDDGNPCTQDIYSYKSGLCSYIKLTGCCGNKTCEAGETYKTCSADCPNCDDKNECTIDEYDYHLQKCVNAPILDVVCCGNTVCEIEETYEKCAKDCPNCDDDNECTNDSYDYHEQKCINEIIVPCCGNGICDEDVEEYSSCPVDCPDCDDNSELTAGSFNYETQECEHIVTHYFIDDFESGVRFWNFWAVEGAPTTTGWETIVLEDGNTVLKGTGHSWANLQGKEWGNYILKLRFKKTKGWLHVNFRNNFTEDGLDRYFVSLCEEAYVNLEKQISPSNTIKILKWLYFGFDENWHALEIRGYDNIINVYIDDELLIKYKDTESPFLSGGVALETSGRSDYCAGCPESEFLVDDVEIKVITEEDIIYP